MSNSTLTQIQDIKEYLDEKLERAKEQYNYQPHLTPALDELTQNLDIDFNDEIILKMVLWKTNRYPTISPDLISAINILRHSYKQEDAKAILRRLLTKKESRGFNLPMASTILRFTCPEQFQIIDQRVYRFITKGVTELKIPYNVEAKINLYFNYLERLRAVCVEYNIPFSESDRLLYQLDKNENKDFSINS